jgi:hypothetical protein
LSLELEKGEADNEKINHRDIYLLESEDPSPIPEKAYLEIREFNREGGTERIIYAGKPEMKQVAIVGFHEFTKKRKAPKKGR